MAQPLVPCQHGSGLNERARAAAHHLWDCGVLLASIAGLVFSGSAVLIKLTHGRVPVLEIVLFRSMVSMIFTLCLAWYSGVEPLWGHRRHLPLLVARGVFGTISVACSFSAFVLLPLGDAATIAQLRPPIAALVARVLLQEPLGLQGAAGCVVSLLGVIILARPPFLFGHHEAWTHARLLGMGLGLTFTLSSAIVSYLIRRMGKSESTLTIALWFHTSTTLLTLGPVLGGFPQAATVPTPFDLLLMSGIAFSTFVGQLLMTRALQVTEIAKVTATGFASVIYGHAFGTAFFNEAISWSGALGGVVIFVGVLVVVVKGSPRIGSGKGGPGVSAQLCEEESQHLLATRKNSDLPDTAGADTTARGLLVSWIGDDAGNDAHLQRDALMEAPLSGHQAPLLWHQGQTDARDGLSGHSGGHGGSWLASDQPQEQGWALRSLDIELEPHQQQKQ